MTLKDIALELLEKYQTSETSCIWEFSGNIDESEKLLSSEVEKYKALIETSADVVEQKKGEWETVPNADNGIDFRCSACHRYRFHNGEMRKKYKYCPNCGAKMQEEENE